MVKAGDDVDVYAFATVLPLTRAAVRGPLGLGTPCLQTPLPYPPPLCSTAGVLRDLGRGWLFLVGDAGRACRAGGGGLHACSMPQEAAWGFREGPASTVHRVAVE
jgi:hypothetical protein